MRTWPIVRTLAVVIVLSFHATSRAQQSSQAGSHQVVTPESAAGLYLEHLQEESLSELGLPMQSPQSSKEGTVDSDAHYEQLIHKVARAMNLTPEEEAKFRQRALERRKRFYGLKPPSKLQNASYYQILELWAEKIKDAANRNIQPHDLLDKIHVVFGTLPTGEVNAVSILVPSTKDTYLIAFESGFFDFGDLISLAVANTLPIERTEHNFAVFLTDPVPVMDNVRRHRNLQSRLLEVILAYLVEGRFDTLPASYHNPDDEVHDFMAVSLYEAMGLFVLGHEYGHILRGDLSGASVAGLVAGQNIQRIPHDWEQELGADGIGIQLTYLVMRDANAKFPLGHLEQSSIAKGNLSAAMTGADFFLHCYEIVERAASLIATGSAEHSLSGGDHPPTVLRRVQARQALHAFVSRFYATEVSENDWQDAVKEASRFDQTLEQLFGSLDDSLKELRARGIDLAPTWRQHLSRSH